MAHHLITQRFLRSVGVLLTNDWVGRAQELSSQKEIVSNVMPKKGAGEICRLRALPTAQVAPFESVGEQRAGDTSLDLEAQDPVAGNGFPLRPNPTPERW